MSGAGHPGLAADAGGGLDDHDLHALAERMATVPGVVGISLGEAAPAVSTTSTPT